MKRNRVAGLLLFILSSSSVLPIGLSGKQGGASVDGLVRTVLEKQPDRPFLFAPYTVVLQDLPFVYEVSWTHRAEFRLNGGRLRVKETEQAREDLSPQDGRWHRLNLDGFIRTNTNAVGSRGKEEMDALKALKSSLELLSSAALKRPDEPRSQSLQQFWDEFRAAFRFDLGKRKNRGGRPTTIVEFTPNPAYAPHTDIGEKLLPRITGEMWIDDEDQEIVRLSYVVTADVPDFIVGGGTIKKSSSHSMDLEKQISGQWLPDRAETLFRQAIPSSDCAVKLTVEFSNYRLPSSDPKTKSSEEVNKN